MKRPDESQHQIFDSEEKSLTGKADLVKSEKTRRNKYLKTLTINNNTNIK